jgi:hypothetical protein
VAIAAPRHQLISRLPGGIGESLPADDQEPCLRTSAMVLVR